MVSTSFTEWFLVFILILVLIKPKHYPKIVKKTAQLWRSWSKIIQKGFQGLSGLDQNNKTSEKGS